MRGLGSLVFGWDVHAGLRVLTDWTQLAVLSETPFDIINNLINGLFI